MKKIILSIVLLIVAVFIGYKFLWKKDSIESNTRLKPLTLGKNSVVFNESFGKLLGSYLNLKDAFVARDSIKANAEAKNLAIFADSLKVDEIKEDSAGFIRQTAQTYTGVISGSANALAGEKDFDGKLKEFEMISDAMWTLTRTVQYAGEKLYYQYCPMAFNNKGAYWVSNIRQIRNPYVGVNMNDCGEVADSLDYGGK